jgi:uncharacterized protein YecE (DUF72 family)
MNAFSQPVVMTGTAGSSIPSLFAASFDNVGTHLERYARRFKAVEINSTFYRKHKPQTYAKWASMVPADFRFSVKVPKNITHVRKLQDAGGELDDFLTEVTALAEKLGPLLIQLPPSLEFRETVVRGFFDMLRERYAGEVVCEPRHPLWFTPDAEGLLNEFKVARVAADPARVIEAASPGGWSKLVYYRLHGSPRMYYSSYEKQFIDSLISNINRAVGRRMTVWCIFDNTAAGAATGNALVVNEHFSNS